MKNIFIPEWIKSIAELNTRPLYLVGGYVRNCLAGLPTDDVDMCGELMPDDLILPEGYSSRAKYKRMGTALIVCDIDSTKRIEYTPFRSEVYPDNGRHEPLEVQFGVSLEKDAERRDFTVNSIYADAKTGQITDIFDGISDIENKLIKAANPERVFASDGLRLLRMVRFAAELGYEIEPNTLKCAEKAARNLADITPERKLEELKKILNADIKYGVKDAHYRGLCLLRDLHLIEYIIGELKGLDHLKQSSKYHKYDALEHTFQVVRFSPPSVRLAALLHDIGKAESVKAFGDMHKHAEIGYGMASVILGENGLKISNTEKERIMRLIALHMFDKNGKCSDEEVLMFIAENADVMDDLIALMRADKAGKGFGDVDGRLRIEELYERFKESGAPKNLSELRINGDELRMLGYKGQEIGDKLKELYKICVLHPDYNTREKLVELSRK